MTLANTSPPSPASSFDESGPQGQYHGGIMVKSCEICTVDYIDVFVIVYDSSDFTRCISILLYASLYHDVVTCDYII